MVVQVVNEHLLILLEERASRGTLIPDSNAGNARDNAEVHCERCSWVLELVDAARLLYPAIARSAPRWACATPRFVAVGTRPLS